VEVCTSLIQYNGETAQFSTIRDITERKRTHNKLLESEKRFRLAFDYSYIGKALAVINGPFFWVNKKLCDILGYSSEELNGIRASEITHPDDIDWSMQIIKDQYSGKLENDAFTIEKRYIHKKGHTVWCNTTVALVKDEQNKPLYTIIEMVDITNRKNAEELNLKLRNYLSNIINSMPSVLVGVNSEGKITQWNKKAEAETGYAEKGALDQEISLLIIRFLNP